MNTNGTPFRWYELVYVAILLALLAGSIHFARRSRVGVINLGQVVKELGIEDTLRTEALRLQGDAQKKAESLLKEFLGSQEQLQGRIKEAKDAAAKDKLEQELADLQKQYKSDMEAVREDMGSRAMQLERVVRQSLQPAINHVARKKGLDVVLEMGRPTIVLYGHERVNVTTDVIKDARSTLPPVTELLKKAGPPTAAQREWPVKPMRPAE